MAFELAESYSATSAPQSLETYQGWRDGVAKEVTDFQQWRSESHPVSRLDDQIAHFAKQVEVGRALVVVLSQNADLGAAFINRLLRMGGKWDYGLMAKTACALEIVAAPIEGETLHLLPSEGPYASLPMGAWHSQWTDWCRINLASREACVEAAKSLGNTRYVDRITAASLGVSNFGADAENVAVPAWRYGVLQWSGSSLLAAGTLLWVPNAELLNNPDLAALVSQRAEGLIRLWQAPLQAAARNPVATEIQLRGGFLLSVEVAETVGQGSEEGGSNFTIAGTDIMARGPMASAPSRAYGALEGRLAKEMETRAAWRIRTRGRTLLGGVLEEAQALLLEQLMRNKQEADKLSRRVASLREDAAQRWQEGMATKEKLLALQEAYRHEKRLLTAKRNDLVQLLSGTGFKELCSEAHAGINDAWTTVGLLQGMKVLREAVGKRFGLAFKDFGAMDRLIDNMYVTLRSQLGARLPAPPGFDLRTASEAVEALLVKTEAFCEDPVNVVTLEKSFMARRYWNLLVEEGATMLAEHHTALEHWCRQALQPIEAILKEYINEVGERLQAVGVTRTEAERLQQVVDDLFKKRTATAALHRKWSRLAAALRA